jgi:hypothetical protein
MAALLKKTREAPRNMLNARSKLVPAHDEFAFRITNH